MKQPRTVTYVYGGVALALLLVIATVALVLAPPSPPSVAEFAPRAAEPIEDAPDVQSSRFGTGAAACVAGQTCADETPAPTQKPVVTPAKKDIVKARIRRCYGDPPRQTEDPQSPPCVNYWDGDNGGGTAKGVTADEIRIAVPCANCAADEPLMKLFAAHFNTRYEFYGRQLRVLPFRIPGNERDPVRLRTDAEMVAGELGAFATLGYTSVYDVRAYTDETARRGVVSVDARPTFRTRSDLVDRRPFLWSFGPAWDDLEPNVAEFACTSLAGRPARFAGPRTAASERSFAVLVPRSDHRPDTSPLVGTLSRCDPDLRVVEFPDGDDETQRQLVMTDLQRSGVTTLICACDVLLGLVLVMRAASQVNYEPEWLLTGAGIEDDETQWFATGESTAAQRIHMFGVASRNKYRPYTDEPWVWAVKETDPSYRATANAASYKYEQLLLLASGIQAAGPALTPASFEQGLQRLRFANPQAGQTPYWQATVGFGPGDHAMIDDLALSWWNEAAQAERSATAQGQFCFIERGKRWSAGRWPATEPPFFDRTQPCR